MAHILVMECRLLTDSVEKGGSNPAYWRQPPKQSKGSAGS